MERMSHIDFWREEQVRTSWIGSVPGVFKGQGGQCCEWNEMGWWGTLGTSLNKYRDRDVGVFWIEEWYNLI